MNLRQISDRITPISTNPSVNTARAVFGATVGLGTAITLQCLQDSDNLGKAAITLGVVAILASAKYLASGLIGGAEYGFVRNNNSLSPAQ